MANDDIQNKATHLIALIQDLQHGMLALERRHQDDLQRVNSASMASARNLLHYLALRQVDVRQLQLSLAELGLSSLGRLEASALDGLRNVLRALQCLAGLSSDNHLVEGQTAPPVDFITGRSFLQQHTNMLLGDPQDDRLVRIMVTMPSEAATDAKVIYNLVKAGMNIIRINCAHDSPEAWESMIRNLRKAERELGVQCKVYADLAGPKLRTGSLASSAPVCKIKPQRNIRGQVIMPAVVCFATVAPTPTAFSSDRGMILVESKFIALARKGDILRLRDARDKQREMTVIKKSVNCLYAECNATVYFESGNLIELQRGRKVLAGSSIGELPPVEEPIRLLMGDTLFIIRDNVVGQPVTRDVRGKPTHAATITCTLPEIFDCAKAGERIFFDDGKIGGRITRNTGTKMSVKITQAAPSGSYLGSEKGINLPDTDLNVPALTEKDLTDLAFMASRADIIGMSFVRQAKDISLLQHYLEKLGAKRISTVLKIENRQAFENLPRLLLTGLIHPPLGVMVARGDLAVEVGFERLAEVQEEILWLCEAAHVPVIWATQVLETMAKSGLPSRAEVTDAVMSGRAECVMLNKGPYMVDVVSLLRGILERMSAHQSKKRSLLRPLAISRLD